MHVDHISYLYITFINDKRVDILNLITDIPTLLREIWARSLIYTFDFKLFDSGNNKELLAGKKFNRLCKKFLHFDFFLTIQNTFYLTVHKS